MCVLVVLLVWSASTARASFAARPNIVLILADDLGWTDLGSYGSGYYQTPAIDRLASEGMRFTAAYTNGPNCAPTRACLMTGQYSPRHGIFTVGTAERGEARFRRLVPIQNTTRLAAEHWTLAEALRASGYRTCHIGKWHLGQTQASRPRSQGFDVTIGSDIPIGRVGHFSPYRSSDLADGPEGEYLTDRLTDEAIAFLRASRRGPFFLYLAHHAVHTPIRAKQPLVEYYRKLQPQGGHHHAAYAAMISSLDESVGRVVREIDELGLADNTLILFFSDNGGHAAFTSNALLRGSKGMLYEGGIRVPLTARWRGHVPAASTCDEAVIGIDLFPTFLELAGGEAAAGVTLDGVSLAGLLSGGTPTLEREALYWHFPAYLEAYTPEQGRWRTTPAGAIRMGDWKLHEFFEDGRLELYNLAEDIGETTDLANRFPEKRDELHAELKAWREEIEAPVPTQRNPVFEP